MLGGGRSVSPRCVAAWSVCVLVASALLVAVAGPGQPRAVEAFELSPGPKAADLPPSYPSGADVEDNFDNRGGFFPTAADNWEQRGALVKRATDLDVFPPGFAEPEGTYIGKQLKARRGPSSAKPFHQQQLSKVSGNEIVGDPARVDQPGKGELIFSEDGTPVQPTPWDIQWDGGVPAWTSTRKDTLMDASPMGDDSAGGDMDEAQDAEEREAEAFAAVPDPDENSVNFDENFELARKAAHEAAARYAVVAQLAKHAKLENELKEREMRGSKGKPQEKHMWQYWATKEDDLKARAAGKAMKKVWEVQRKYLKKMKTMCPFCSAMPGPKELSDMFCRTCEQFPESWGDKLIMGKPGARGTPFSGSPPNYLNDDARPLHHTPQDKGYWWGDNDAWYDGWEQHRTDLWPPYSGPYTDEDGDGKMLKGGGWKAMADDLNRGGNDYPEYKRTGMAPEYWERPGDEHDLDNVGKLSHDAAAVQGEEFLDAGDGGEITGATSFEDDWKKVRPVDKLPPWCDRILGCPPPYDDKGSIGQFKSYGEDEKTMWSWPYNENGKKIQLGTKSKALLKGRRASHNSASSGTLSAQQNQAAILESHAEKVEAKGTVPMLQDMGVSGAGNGVSAEDVKMADDAMTAADEEAEKGVDAIVNEPLQEAAALDMSHTSGRSHGRGGGRDAGGASLADSMSNALDYYLGSVTDDVSRDSSDASPSIKAQHLSTTVSQQPSGVGGVLDIGV